MNPLTIASRLEWGTYGKGALEAYEQHCEPLPPMRWVRLGDCDTDHLKAILLHLSVPTHGRRTVVLYVLAIQIILTHRRGFLRRIGELLCGKS